MIDLKENLNLPRGLASYTNTELYCIISNLFAVGGFDLFMSAKDRLYLCFDKHDFDGERYLQFILISTARDYSLDQPITKLFLGGFHAGLEKIEIYGSNAPSNLFNAEADFLDDGTKISELLYYSKRVHIEPIHFVNGLLEIISKKEKRQDSKNSNGSFSLGNYNTFLRNYRVNKPEHKYLKITVVNENDESLDFSGHYYLIAEPYSEVEIAKNGDGVLIYEHNLNSANWVTTTSKLDGHYFCTIRESSNQFQSFQSNITKNKYNSHTNIKTEARLTPDQEISLASEYFYAKERGLTKKDALLIAEFKKMTATFPERIKKKGIQHKTVSEKIGILPVRLWRRFTNNNWKSFEETAGMLELLNWEIQINFKIEPGIKNKTKPQSNQHIKNLNS